MNNFGGDPKIRGLLVGQPVIQFIRNKKTEGSLHKCILLQHVYVFYNLLIVDDINDIEVILI